MDRDQLEKEHSPDLSEKCSASALSSVDCLLVTVQHLVLSSYEMRT